MSQTKVLISGGGIAGTVLAYWLGKYDFSVVVLERSSDSSTSGQIIDVEGPAQKIVERMGILDTIRSHVTHEAGIQLVDASNKVMGTVPVGSSSASNEIEIMRPELAKILFNAANSHDNVEIRFNTSIVSITNTKDKVTAEIKNNKSGSTTNEEYDILVACDGLRSRTRDMILSPSQREGCIKSINTFAAFFSIPTEPQDRPFARLCHFPGRRTVTTKPQSEKETSVYLLCLKQIKSLHDARESRDMEKQKAAVKEHFSGLGWETDRCLEQMVHTKNFYFEEISQVYLDQWSQGRCVLVGDTAYCPSPLTGQGTNLAILGSYVLASKLVENRNNPEEAFQAYEKAFRPYVNEVQPIPLGGRVPLWINPDTAWGIWILRTIFGWISWLQLFKYLPDIMKDYPLPNL